MSPPSRILRRCHSPPTGSGSRPEQQSLKEAGLTRINVSLDTLDAERFRTLTRRDRLDDVLAGIAAAQSAGLAPVKINTVLMRSINDDEVLGLVEWALRQGLALRFIEQMPLDAHKSWSRTEMVKAAEILEQLEATYTLRPTSAPRGSEPAETWDVVAADGTRARPRRGDRVGHAAVLLRVRPGPAHQRRSAEELSLRAG